MIRQLKFTEIIHETMELWPNKIYIADGNFITENSANFPILNQISEINDTISLTLSELHNSLNWVIFSFFHKQAKVNLSNGKKFVLKEELDYKELHKNFQLDYIEDESGYKNEIASGEILYENDYL